MSEEEKKEEKKEKKEEKKEEIKIETEINEDGDMPTKKLSMDEFMNAVTRGIENKLKEYDKVDRKNVVLVDKDNPEKSEDEFKNLPKEERWKKFLIACVHKDKVHLKALAEGVAADGGNLVPDDFKAVLVKRLEAPYRMRSIVSVKNTVTDLVKVPAQDGHVKVAWATENTTKSTTSMNFDQVEIPINTLAGLIYSSEELMADSAINLMQEIANDFGNAMGDEEDRVIVVGSGTGQPTGIQSCTLNSKASSSSSAVQADDIIGMFYDLPEQYRNQARWVMNNRVLKEIMLLKDSQNRYLIERGLNGQNSTSIYGVPVIVNNWLPTNVIYLGDWSYYWLVDRQQIAMKTTTEGAGTFEKDQIAIRVTERIGGKCIMGVGLRKLTSVPVS